MYLNHLYVFSVTVNTLGHKSLPIEISKVWAIWDKKRIQTTPYHVGPGLRCIPSRTSSIHFSECFCLFSLKHVGFLVLLRKIGKSMFSATSQNQNVQRILCHSSISLLRFVVHILFSCWNSLTPGDCWYSFSSHADLNQKRVLFLQPKAE